MFCRLSQLSIFQLLFFRTVFLKLASVVFLYVVVYLQIFCQRYDLNGIAYNAKCQHCDGMRVITIIDNTFFEV